MLGHRLDGSYLCCPVQPPASPVRCHTGRGASLSYLWGAPATCRSALEHPSSHWEGLCLTLLFGLVKCPVEERCTVDGAGLSLPFLSPPWPCAGSPSSDAMQSHSCCPTVWPNFGTHWPLPKDKGFATNQRVQNTLMISEWLRKSKPHTSICCIEQFWHFQQCFCPPNHSLVWALSHAQQEAIPSPKFTIHRKANLLQEVNTEGEQNTAIMESMCTDFQSSLTDWQCSVQDHKLCLAVLSSARWAPLEQSLSPLIQAKRGFTLAFSTRS